MMELLKELISLTEEKVDEALGHNLKPQKMRIFDTTKLAQPGDQAEFKKYIIRKYKVAERMLKYSFVDANLVDDRSGKTILRRALANEQTDGKTWDDIVAALNKAGFLRSDSKE